MQNPNAKLATFAILLTTGVGLNLIGIAWLRFLGLGLMVLAAVFTSHPSRPSLRTLFPVLAIIAVGGCLAWEGSHNVRTPCPFWYWVVLVPVWLFALAWEYRSWLGCKAAAPIKKSADIERLESREQAQLDQFLR